LKELDSKLVQRINEIYHDLENVAYDERHRYMLKLEEAFWVNMAEKYLVRKESVACIDYGTGTGFVAAVIAPYLKKQDSLICCDVSGEMLKVCEKNLGEKSFACKCSFRKIDGADIPFPEKSLDVITVNSVLHHIFDISHFSQECERTLKPGGMLLVAHEPNKNSTMQFPGNFVSGLAKLLLGPQFVFFRAVERIPLLEKIVRPILSKISKGYRCRNAMLSKIAEQLTKEKLLDFELRGTEIQQVVDFHSQFGFDARELFEEVFRGFVCVEFETYNHLGFFAEGKLASAIERYLRDRWPDAGREMRFVLRHTLCEPS